MAGGRDIKAGRAFVEIYTKNDKLTAGLKAAQARLNAFAAGVGTAGKSLVALGAAASLPLLGSLKVYAELGDSLSKASQRTGVTVEKLSTLNFAAEQSAVTVETLEKGLRGLGKTVKDAGDGSQGAVDALRQIGLSAKDLRNLTPDEQLRKVADRLKTIQEPGRRAAIAMEILGRAGSEMMPLLLEGSEGIAALEQQARDLGLVISSDAAAGAVKLGDELASLLKQVRAVAFHIGSGLAPTITSLIQRVQLAAVKVIEFVKVNSEIVVGALKVIAVTVATGAALLAFAGVVKLGAIAIGGLIGALAFVKGAIAAAAAGIALLASPLALIAAGTAVVIATLYDLSQVMGDVGAYLSQAFAALKVRAVAAFDGIRDALKSGDITLAAKVLWLALKAEWARGVAALGAIWDDVKSALVETWSDAVSLFAQIFVGGLGLIRVAWVNFIEFIQSFGAKLAQGVGGYFDWWKKGWKQVSAEAANALGLIDDAERNRQSNEAEGDANKSKRQREAVFAEERKRIATESEAARRAITEDVRGQLDILNRNDAADKVGRDAERQKKIDGAQKEVIAAQKELADAIEVARQQAARPENNPSLPNSPARKAQDAAAGGAEIAGRLASASTSGTFSARGAAVIGGVGQMVEEQRKTNSQLARLERAVETLRTANGLQ